MFTQNANKIFAQAIDDYHRYDDVDHQLSNPYAEGTIDHLLYMKNWVDTVQWHLEDIIRDPRIDPVEALKIKRRIDKSNQVRTDMVEYIDSYLLDKYKNIDVQPGARINTETPAWAIDRLSILALKIYHMRQEVLRKDVDEAHRAACQQKLDVKSTSTPSKKGWNSDLVATVTFTSGYASFRARSAWGNIATSPRV